MIAGLRLTLDNRRWSELYQQEFRLKVPKIQLVSEMETKRLEIDVYVVGTHCDLGIRGSLT